jgi:hypothetical protein
MYSNKSITRAGLSHDAKAANAQSRAMAIDVIVVGGGTHVPTVMVAERLSDRIGAEL